MYLFWYKDNWIKYLGFNVLFVSLLYWELIIFFSICCCLTFSITSLHCEKHLQTRIKSQFKIITHKKLTNLNCCPSSLTNIRISQSGGGDNYVNIGSLIVIMRTVRHPQTPCLTPVWTSCAGGGRRRSVKNPRLWGRREKLTRTLFASKLFLAYGNHLLG